MRRAIPAGRTGIVCVNCNSLLRTYADGAGSENPVVNVAAYVDGFNLYYGMKSKFGRRYLWLDLVKLVQTLRPDDNVITVRYFTAMVKGEPDAAANQTRYISALRAHSGPVLDVRVAWFKTRTLAPCKICAQHFQCDCPRRSRGREEKETDVALAATMVADAAVEPIDLSLLISADSDFAPAVSAVKKVRPQHPVIMAMPPGNAKPHKRFSDVGHFSINETALRQSQLPAVVLNSSTGEEWHRPKKWA